MLQSVDGVIARNLDTNQVDELDWGSSQDKKSFKELTEQSGVMILGSTTFRNMPKFVFKKRLGVVLTRSVDKLQAEHQDSGLNLLFVEPDPVEVVQRLEELKYQTVILCGGSKVNGMFLKANLVDEIHLTIAPKIFGTGVRLVDLLDTKESQDIRLEIIEQETLATSEILIKYRIVK